MRNIRDYFKSKNTIIDERNDFERKLLAANRALVEAHLERSMLTVELIHEKDKNEGLTTEVESLDAFHRYLSQNIEDFDSYTIDYYEKSQENG